MYFNNEIIKKIEVHIKCVQEKELDIQIIVLSLQS